VTNEKDEIFQTYPHAWVVTGSDVVIDADANIVFTLNLKTI